jgi:hypothetical protein
MSYPIFSAYQKCILASYAQANQTSSISKLRDDITRFQQLILSSHTPYQDLWSEQLRSSPFKSQLRDIHTLSLSALDLGRQEELLKIKEFTRSFLKKISENASAQDIDFIDTLQLKNI